MGVEETLEPESLYKYYAFNEYTQRIFTHNEIYFAAPKEFNDPFDSKVGLSFKGTKKQWKDSLREIYKRRKPNLTKKQRLAEVDRIIREDKYKQIPDNMGYSFLEKIGIFCMSEKNNHILMWSHYSDSHTGFCLVFDATTQFFGSSQKVIYKRHYPEVNFFNSTQWEKTQAMLLTKADFWEYEQEWRIIDNKKGSGVQIFPEKLLTGVIMGCRISEDDRQKIIEWSKDRKNRPILYQAKVKRREFGLDIEEIVY